MKPEILVSKKGTKVVIATDLYQSLELPSHHYGATVKKWLEDVYEFSDGIRQPEPMKDYANRPAQENLFKDYYLSVELAKRITLNSRSRHKQKIALQLSEVQDHYDENGLLSVEQVLAVVELTRVMGLVSCQLATEKEHHKVYESRNQNNPANWWNFRKNILGYSIEDLRKSLRRQGLKAGNKSMRQCLMQLDKYEMIRIAVIDLFMAMGKPEKFALSVGEMAKAFARELQIEIFDDRNTSISILPEVNQELVNEIRNLSHNGYLRHWESLKMAS